MRKGSSNHRISPTFRGLVYPVQQVSYSRIQLYTWGLRDETSVRDISAAASNNDLDRPNSAGVRVVCCSPPHKSSMQVSEQTRGNPPTGLNPIKGPIRDLDIVHYFV